MKKVFTLLLAALIAFSGLLSSCTEEEFETRPPATEPIEPSPW